MIIQRTQTQIVSSMTFQSLNSKRIESPCLISFRCRVTSTPPTRVVSTSSILATSLMYRLQTCRKAEFRRWKPSIAKGIALHIFCFGCGLACDCKNARTEKRHLQHLRKQLLDTHLARRFIRKRQRNTTELFAFQFSILRCPFNSVGTLCPSCLWGTWTKLNHIENIPSVWMFCFGCPLASRAPLVRIQDIATAKNLTMQGLHKKLGF